MVSNANRKAENPLYRGNGYNYLSTSLMDIGYYLLKYYIVFLRN
jgi:hypothetical protein